MRTRLVKAAWRVIATEGIEAATLRRVAVEAGCTTGLITHYFTDKNELVTFAYRRVLDKMIADADAAIAAASGITDKLLAAIEAVEPVRAGSRDFTVVLMNFWAAAAVNPTFAMHCRADYKRWRALIGRVVKTAVSRRELRADTDIKVLVDLLTLLSDGFSVGMTLTPAAYRTRRRHAILRQVLQPFVRP
jgi:AcrR family transcriptional regulator